jgi:hypothetical protein
MKQLAHMHALEKRYRRLVLSEQCGAVVPFSTSTANQKVGITGACFSVHSARVALPGHVLQFNIFTDTARHLLEPIGRLGSLPLHRISLAHSSNQVMLQLPYSGSATLVITTCIGRQRRINFIKSVDIIR